MSFQEGINQDQTVASTIDERLATHDLLDTLAAAGRFTAFLSVVRLSGMESTLHLEGPFTVFAPEDSGFSLPDGEDRDAAARWVSRHLVRGDLRMADLRTVSELKVLDGSSLPVETRDAEVRVGGGARILEGDIACTNGAIHRVEAPVR
jgi:uncharacterized surface protein with fasciclin (FAS1) repeats